MVNQYGQQPQKIRTALMVFIRGSAAPIIMYIENPVTVYEELKKLIETGQNKLYEKECYGPIRKVCFMTGEVIALAIQE